MSVLGKKEVTSVRLLVHPGCILESGLNLGQLRAYIDVYKQLLQVAVDMGDDELMICLPCDYSGPFEKKKDALLGKFSDNSLFRQVLELNDDALDPDTEIVDDLTQKEIMDPLFLFRALAEILGDRFVISLLSQADYTLGNSSDALFAKAEEDWKNRGFTLSPEASVLAYGEYMTCCVRGYAKDFTLKYDLGRAVVVSAMTDLPIAAVMEGGDRASLIEWLVYLRDGTNSDDKELLDLIKSDLKHVEYYPDWINTVIRDFT